jgi:hypothetical protein
MTFVMLPLFLTHVTEAFNISSGLSPLINGAILFYFSHKHYQYKHIVPPNV